MRIALVALTLALLSAPPTQAQMVSGAATNADPSADPPSASSPAEPDPPEQPEVRFAAIPKQAIIAEFETTLRADKFRLVEADDFHAVFEKNAGLGASLLVGSRYDPQAIYRVTITMLTVGDTTRLEGRQFVVGNAHSAFEHRIELDQKKHRRAMQSLLERVRDQIASNPPR
jgi:hypothetical protein